MIIGDRILKRPDAIDVVAPNAGGGLYARASVTDSALPRRLMAFDCHPPGEVTQRLLPKFPALLRAAWARGQSVGGS